MPTGLRARSALPMSSAIPRNFNCPESGERCADNRCTKTHCCEQERLRVYEIQKSVSAKSRAETSIMREIVDDIIKSIKRRISN
jgi:hypothetical protein